MTGPEQASPAQGAVSKTDSPQSSNENAPAGKPARFRVVNSSIGTYWIDANPRVYPLGHGLGLTFCDFQFASDEEDLTRRALEKARQAREVAESVCKILNALDAERRGDNPSDVQRQLLEELRGLVALQRQALESAGPMVELAKAPMRGNQPEPNVNDLMLEVGRAFGLTDVQVMNLDNLKGFCEGAWRMEYVPQKAKRPLMLLMVKGALSATPQQVERCKAVLKEFGLA